MLVLVKFMLSFSVVVVAVVGVLVLLHHGREDNASLHQLIV